VRLQTTLRHDRVARCRVTSCAKKDEEAWSDGFWATCCVCVGGGRAARLQGAKVSMAKAQSELKVHWYYV
jgi:hypothetical protein